MTTLPTTDTIDGAELRRLLAEDEDLRILDVRTGAEFETVHIEGSFNVPLDTLGEHVDDLADVDHTVVLVCQSGGRATQAHGKLAAAGKDGLHILEGGMTGWQAGGGEVVRGQTERWALERQVRFVAGSIVLFSVLLSLLVPALVWVAAAVGAGLAYAAITDTCAMAAVLGRLPYNQGAGCDIQGVLAEIERKEA